MASKKVIAICQSGGEFVTNKDGSLTYNGGEAYAVDIDETTKLDDFKKEVADMFDCNVATMSIKYFLPGNRKTLIKVSKDRDLVRMVSFMADSNSVDVFIISEEEVPAGNVSNMPCSRSSRTMASEAAIPSAAADDPLDMNVATDDCEDPPLVCTPVRSYAYYQHMPPQGPHP